MFPFDAVSAMQLCYEAYADPGHQERPLRQRLAAGFAALTEDSPPWQLIPLAYRQMPAALRCRWGW